jgi:uncharacterized membrane protein
MIARRALAVATATLALATAQALANSASPVLKAALAWAAKHRPTGAALSFASCYAAGRGTALCRVTFYSDGSTRFATCEKDIFVSPINYRVERELGSACHKT